MVDDEAEPLSTGLDDHARKRQRKLRLLIGTAVATAAGLGGYWLLTELPERAVEQAKQRALDCVNAIYESGEGDPADCRQASAGLSLAGTLPWSREAARGEEAVIEALVLEYQLELASVRDIDVEARDQAARELIALHRGEQSPQRGALGKLDSAGANELMVELASAEDSTNERKLALRAALLLGDWEAAGRIAKTSAAGDLGFGQNAAIVACILGDRETAAARLREADLAWREHENKPWLDVLLIEAHCGLLRASDEPLESYMASALQQAASLYEPGATLEESYHPHDVAMSVARTAIAQRGPIAWDKDLRIRDVDLIERIDARQDLGLGLVAAGTRDERPGAGGPVIVAELEAGARRLAELSAAAPIEHTFEYNAQTIRPRESLAWGGFCLASVAAAERLWRGQIEEARAILAVANELAATDEFTSLRLKAELPMLGQYALLDPEAALRIARSVPDDELAATPAMAQVVFRIQLAFVYEQAGELERALEMSTGAVELLPRMPSGSLVSMGISAGAPWVHGALLFRAGREGSLEVEAPEDLRAAEGPEVFAYWWTAALADPSAQVGHRWRAGGESKMWLPLEPWSIPSMLEVLARSGPADRREAWLDRVSADMFVDPLDMIRARAIAAERLGDAAAAERWREREAALLERLQDDRAAALYRMLE